jgi:acetyl esterase/lipase
MGRHHLWFMALLVIMCATMIMAVCKDSGAADQDLSLVFNPNSYTTLNVTVDGAPMQLRQYKVVYVAKPIKMASTQPNYGPNGYTGDVVMDDAYGYQTMYIVVPEKSFNNSTTAIFLMVGNGGWRTTEASSRIANGTTFVGSGTSDNIGPALKAGYIVVNAGTRSRGAKAADGSWAGKAPAVVVDAKAAIRYLRLNDSIMPGSAEHIIITGGSGGGGLSVAVAASGNSPDYYPYLYEIGAAGVGKSGQSTIRDDIFATVAYCPITDLGNADIAYEWQYNAVRTASNTSGNTYSPAMQKASTALAAAYPAYLAGFKLKMEDGATLTADKMDDAIVMQLKKEIEKTIATGAAVPAIGENFVVSSMRGTITAPNDWLTVRDGKVTDINYLKYLNFVTKVSSLKAVPAFDSTGVTGTKVLSGENSLFGSNAVEYSNFMQWAWDNNDVKGDGSGTDDTGKTWAQYVADPSTTLDDQIKMVGPMPYLNSAADSAPYWYYRHGMLDRDTSFAVEVGLYYALINDPSVKDVNFRLSWMQGHGGNWDVDEAFAWIAGILKANP